MSERCVRPKYIKGGVIDVFMAGESLAGNDTSEASCTTSSRWSSSYLGNKIETSKDESSIPFSECGSAAFRYMNAPA